MIPRSEYPRPRLVRKNWECLNGEWQFEIDDGNSGKERRLFEAESLKDKILVPFAPESKLSGIEHTDFMSSVWYRKTLEVNKNELNNKRLLLNFGAVDYFTEVWVNGISVGTHKGGYTPFSFDITDVVKDGNNIISVNAIDDTRSDLIPSGKQSTEYYNGGCSYTRTTGIWQTVWTETVSDIYVQKLKITPDPDNEKVYIELYLNKEGSKDGTAEASFGNEKHTAEFKITGRQATVCIDIPNPKLWNIGAPNLYDLHVKINDGDEFTSYFGMRKIELDGYKFRINGKSVFQRLILDQAFYPDGIYTAPTDEDLKKDIELSMAAGFNGARMHMKIFEPRFSYWADKLGYILWGEYPNWGLDVSKPEALPAMLSEWTEAVERDYNSPAIIGWCPFNETWFGVCADIFKTVYAVTKAIDKTRPICDSSGGEHVITDIFDYHDYQQDPEIFRKTYADFAEKDVEPPVPKLRDWERSLNHKYIPGQPYFVSEFGGTRFTAGENGTKGWGYGKAVENTEEFYERFEGLTKVLLEHPKMFGYCYTQLTDVFQELNGIYTFDRKPKFDPERLKKIQSLEAAIEKEI